MEKLRLGYLPLGILCAYLIKAFIGSPSINEVLIVGLLTGLTVFYESRAENKRLKALQEELEKQKAEKIQQDKIISDLANSITSVKITAGFKGVNLGNR